MKVEYALLQLISAMKRFRLLVLLLFMSVNACADDPTPLANPNKQKLIEIMKGVNFVPQMGKDNPFCKAFYEDFKQQKHIEHIQPIATAETYDEPVLKPYQDQCPKLDFRRSYAAHAREDTSKWTDEDWRVFGRPIDGVGNFQLYKLDINNDSKDDEELIFYYEGTQTEDRRLPVGGPMIVKKVISPEARGYHVIDLRSCRLSGLVHFNQGGSARWTRNGIIRYKDINAIYVFKAARVEQPSFQRLQLYKYTERLNRLAPTCTYRRPRKSK